MTIEVVKRLINVEEYYRMAEVGILKPDDRVELINGEIFERSPIGSRHAAIVDRLARLLNQSLQRKVNVRVQNPVRLDINNEPEPDIAILKYKADDYSSAHPVPSDVLAIIEVADSSVRFDREVKAPLYAGNAISEYWIIDMDNNRIEVFSNPSFLKRANPIYHLP